MAEAPSRGFPEWDLNMLSLKNPNIIIVVIDAARPDYFSCYGFPKMTTPNINKLAQEGVLFENVISTAPWTIPSHGSMFTSLYPYQHKATWETLRLKEGIPTIFDIFTERGYEAAAISANSLIVSPYSMFGNKTKILGPSVCNELDISSFARDFDYKKTNSQKIADYFVEYLGQIRPDKPQIIYLNFYDLHAKYLAREPFYSRYVNEENKKILQDLGDFYALHFKEMNDEIEISEPIVSALRASYTARLAMIDEDLGRVIEKLKGRGFLDNSILIITSDHGDVLGDHKKPSFHHQFSIYNSLLNIPLIFYCKTIGRPKRISVPLIQNIDILPTILELCGIKKPSSLNNSPGVSLTEYLFNSNYNVIPRKYAVSTYESPLRFIVRNKKKVNPAYLKNLMAIQDERYKLIFSNDGRQELYCIREDKFEKENVADKLPQKVTELKEAFYEIMKKYNAPADGKGYAENNPFEQEIMVQKLRSLGYIE